MKKGGWRSFIHMSVAASMLFSISVAQVEAVRAGSGRASGTSRWSSRPAPSYSRPSGGQRSSGFSSYPNSGSANPSNRPNPTYAPQQANPAYARQAAPQAPATPYPPIAQPSRRSWLGPLAGVAAGLGLAHLMGSSSSSYANGNNPNMMDANSSAYGAMPNHSNGGFPWFWTLILVAAGWWLWKRRGNKQPGQSSTTTNHPSWTSPAAGSSFTDVKHTISYEHDLSQPPQQRELASDPILSDPNAFLQAAKQYFTSLQTAFDNGNLEPFRDWMLPELYTDLFTQIQERGQSANHTDVLALDAEIIDQKAEQEANWVTVRFHGTTREMPNPNPQTFNEAWHFKQFHQTPNDPWKLAGIEPIEG
jgi:predicted lipid-binding transport protein (Tim44 family)